MLFTGPVYDDYRKISVEKVVALPPRRRLEELEPILGTAIPKELTKIVVLVNHRHWEGSFRAVCRAQYMQS
jgi:hypothetical protein